MPEEFKLHLSGPDLPGPPRNNDVWHVITDVDMHFQYDPKIPCDWDEAGNATDWEEGFYMIPLPTRYVYKDQPKVFLYSAFREELMTAAQKREGYLKLSDKVLSEALYMIAPDAMQGNQKEEAETMRKWVSCTWDFKVWISDTMIVLAFLETERIKALQPKSDEEE